PPSQHLSGGAFNGRITGFKQESATATTLALEAVDNSDPNTFDRTLVTITNGAEVFTFKVDDLVQGPLFAPSFGVAVIAGDDPRSYSSIGAACQAQAGKTLYDRVAEMPEQTWQGAWAGLPRKKSDIYFPLGLDGGRQRFRLEPDGSIQ